MARLELKLAHSYHAQPAAEEDYALLPMDLTFRDGGAYALLGPSGCGKTTMLNIISGLLSPSQGSVHFNGREVTTLSTRERNIAQVFQFPVIYDTMTVRENLAFPLRNRGWVGREIDQRVNAIAEMLELSKHLNKRATGLSADLKQKISLGRGLVRPDVSAVLFDEPLTVIDPHLKWQLRRKLKEVHRELKLTLIYVTHDQVEALTFAEEIVVMSKGKIMQIGSAAQLYAKPSHTFVGHFIGSPGMNFLPCRFDGQRIHISDQHLQPPPSLNLPQESSALQLGIRPEYASLAEGDAADAVFAKIEQVHDLGNYQLITARLGNALLRVRIDPQKVVRTEQMVWLQIINAHTCFYHEGNLLP